MLDDENIYADRPDPIDPQLHIRNPSLPPRSFSPDIDTIISATPRPSRRSISRGRASTASTSSLPPSPSLSKSLSREIKRRASEGIVTPAKYRGRPWDPFSSYSESAVDRSAIPHTTVTDDDTRSWIDPDEFRVVDPQSFAIDDEEREREARLERALEGDGSESDSSLDIHTPLPHLMLRHGLLSPHSKLFPQHDTNPRPDSIISSVSTTASGLPKDSRDTPMRRTRHRDGRLLKGGVGLTTGLGWSDSEDEDAPSALTRRISSLNLSRRPSASSIHSSSSYSHPKPSSRVHPLSRSYSSGSLHDPDQYDDYPHGLDEFGRFHDGRHVSEGSSSSLPNFKQRKSKLRLTTSSPSSIPPTSWQKRSPGGRASTSSAGSGFSLEVSIPEHEHEHAEGAEAEVEGYEERTTTVASRTPRSMRPPKINAFSSTPPITLRDDPPLEAGTIGRKLDKDKSLPPLPPSLKRTAITSSNLRARTFVNVSGTSPPLMHSTPASGSLLAKPTTTPRPLRLPQSNLVQPQKPFQNQTTSRDRPAVPVPSISSSSLSSSMSKLPSPLLLVPRSPSTSVSESPVTPSSSSSFHSSLGSEYGNLNLNSTSLGEAVRPKPRTGTGMVYRNSTATGSASRMRMPSSVMRTTMRTTAAAPGGGGARPIAL